MGMEQDKNIMQQQGGNLNMDNNFQMPNKFLGNPGNEMQQPGMQKDIIPVQQPVMLAGGSLPPLNVYHNPVWMSGNPEESQQPQSLNSNPISNQNQNYDRLNF